MTSGPLLIISHGHPDFSIGGAENAAYAQFLEMRRQGLDVYFLARISAPAPHFGVAVSNRTADGRELLLHLNRIDHFRHSQPDKSVIYRDFRGLLERLRPASVHFHHYVHLGIELIREVRNTLPGAKILLTLHEYLAICHAQGQMLKTSGLLCERAAPLDCTRCFPEYSPQEFFMRELFIKSFLELCDWFICPSAFLQQRYVSWGLPAAKTIVLDNGQILTECVQAPPDDAHLRFVVLGQLSVLKGTPLLLEAVQLLPADVRRLIRIEIHGTMDQTNTELVARMQSALGRSTKSVRLCGPYRRADVGRIISAHGWVIQPSIWWENSPLVIQEAFVQGRPVICADVGGMAEKVRHRVDGLHFRVGSASSLADTIAAAGREPGLWESLRRGIAKPPSIQSVVNRLLQLCETVPATS